MNRSTFRMIKYMNWSLFSKARYMNGVGFEILARTPVPQLPLRYPPTRFAHLFDVCKKFNTVGLKGQGFSQTLQDIFLAVVDIKIV